VFGALVPDEPRKRVAPFGALFHEARAHAVKGNPDQALDSLREAFDAGFRDVEELDSDPDFAAVREHPMLIELMQQHGLGKRGSQ